MTDEKDPRPSLKLSDLAFASSRRYGGRPQYLGPVYFRPGEPPFVNVCGEKLRVRIFDRPSASGSGTESIVELVDPVPDKLFTEASPELFAALDLMKPGEPQTISAEIPLDTNGDRFAPGSVKTALEEFRGVDLSNGRDRSVSVELPFVQAPPDGARLVEKHDPPFAPGPVEMAEDDLKHQTRTAVERALGSSAGVPGPVVDSFLRGSARPRERYFVPGSDAHREHAVAFPCVSCGTRTDVVAVKCSKCCSRDDVLPDGPWKFDQRVVDAFEDMLRRSIPDYETMRGLVNSLGEAFVEKAPGSTVLDLGCARGEGLVHFVAKFGARNRCLGVDASGPMVEAARRRFAGLPYVEICRRDLRKEFPDAGRNVSLVLLVLTLQFVPVEHRQKILAESFNALRPGGALILVEKLCPRTVEQGVLFGALYDEHKRRAGYSPDQIERKKLSLEGVLVPLTEGDNVGRLEAAGFRGVYPFWRWLNFGGYLARKP